MAKHEEHASHAGDGGGRLFLNVLMGAAALIVTGVGYHSDVVDYMFTYPDFKVLIADETDFFKAYFPWLAGIVAAASYQLPEAGLRGAFWVPVVMIFMAVFTPANDKGLIVLGIALLLPALLSAVVGTLFTMWGWKVPRH